MQICFLSCTYCHNMHNTGYDFTCDEGEDLSDKDILVHTCSKHKNVMGLQRAIEITKAVKKQLGQ